MTDTRKVFPMATGTTYRDHKLFWTVVDDEQRARASFHALLSQKDGVEWRPRSPENADHLYEHFVFRLNAIVAGRYGGDRERVAAEKPKFESTCHNFPFET